jgi:hypothetical protein
MNNNRFLLARGRLILAMVTLVVSTSIVSGPVFAEDTKECEAKKSERVSIKPVAYIDASELGEFLDLLGVEYVINPRLNTITLKGSPPERVDSAIRGIEALDEPVPTIELAVYLIEASHNHNETIDATADLRKATEQLQGAFGFSGFRLLDSVSLRVLTGRGGEITSSARLGDDPKLHPNYKVSFRVARLLPPDTEAFRVRLEDLRFELSGADSLYAALRTDVEVEAGQMAVIGRSTARGLDGNLVLIIDPKVIEIELIDAENG